MEWVKFPTTGKKKQAALKERFQKERNFKGIIGCIDCIHVAIVRPRNHRESYVNHKGLLHQRTGTASHDLEILNINARFLGSVHDSFIWRHFAVRNEMIRLYDSED